MVIAKANPLGRKHSAEFAETLLTVGKEHGPETEERKVDARVGKRECLWE